MTDNKTEKYMITIDRNNKVYEYSEIQSDFSKLDYSYPKDLNKLSDVFKEKGLSIPEDSKFSLTVNEENEVVAITLVGEDAPEFSQLFFESKEEADKTIMQENYKPSYHIMPPEIRELLDNFFSGKVCFFDGYEELRASFLSETDNAPKSKYVSIKSLYEDKVLQKILKR